MSLAMHKQAVIYWFARPLLMEEETTRRSLCEAARGAQIGPLADMAHAGLLHRNNCLNEIALGAQRVCRRSPGRGNSAP